MAASALAVGGFMGLAGIASAAQAPGASRTFPLFPNDLNGARTRRDADQTTQRQEEPEMPMDSRASQVGAPTVVLVHGAWVDASSWAGVIAELQSAGITAIAPANPLRGLSVDAAYIASVVQQIEGPVLLVGHSYGGAVITNAATQAPNVVGLVYAAAFALDEGESLLALLGGFPETLLGAALRPSHYPNGGAEPGVELYVDRASFPAVFAADLPLETATVLAASQRPGAAAGFGEPSGVPGWKTLPSWALVATEDYVIGVEALRFMAQRAGAQTSEIAASHSVTVSQPTAVADVIRTAVAALTPAVPVG